MTQTESGVERWVDVEEPQPGDRALHVNGQLDSREVVAVWRDYVWLRIGDRPGGPFPMKNYTYKRLEK